MRTECEGSSLDSCRKGPALQAVNLAVSTLTTYIVSDYQCPLAPPHRFALSVRSTAIAFPTGIAMYLLYATDNRALKNCTEGPGKMVIFVSDWLRSTVLGITLAKP